MELWGGVECTVNRVGDRYRDQMRLSGHHDRIGDLGAIAALGIRTLRFPVLWERVAPDRPDDHDWAWSDGRLGECARLGIRPIVGLLHHGSGPRYTSLLDPTMPELFGAYAAAVAARYPWADDWTPVNEPNTTARFSALYGAWYPHARDMRSYWLALLGQIDATRAAMRAIRRVNRQARLIQTDDLGETWSTAELSPVADYYNVRRWLGWDLLAGRVDEAHPLWGEAARLGLSERLRAIADDPCPPDIIGVNYYPTSERYLDHRAERLGPVPEVGFHDVEALRVADGTGGLAPLLRQAWERYGVPLAVTECHLGCTREEQLRWLWQEWRACQELRAEGVDVRALTIWALFGSVDWNSLLTVEAGYYEPGAFDVRGDGAPRPTAIARLAAMLASGAVDEEHAIGAMARMAGWWERPIRFTHPPVTIGTPAAPREDASMRPVLITGAGGQLGQAFADACVLRGLTHLSATLPSDDERRVAELRDLYRPWAVIDLSEGDAAGVVARACAAQGIHSTTVSSDLIPDGANDAPCSEREGRALDSGALVVRSGPCFSPEGASDVAESFATGCPSGAEQLVTPTYLPDLVHACLDLVIDGERGAWHLSHGEAITPAAFARRVTEALHRDPTKAPASDSPRPARASIQSQMLPSLDDALERYAAARRTEAVSAPEQAAAFV